MKLRNKKTGEIREIKEILIDGMFKVNSLAELNAEWEDYKEPKEYWYIDLDGEICSCVVELENGTIKDMKQIGNYFETEEEAEKAVKKLMAWKVLNDLGFKICGIRYRDGKNYIEWHVEQDTRDDHFKAEAFNEALHLLFGDTQHESN